VTSSSAPASSSSRPEGFEQVEAGGDRVELAAYGPAAERVLAAEHACHPLASLRVARAVTWLASIELQKASR
jgi:hypothetical protein